MEGKKRPKVATIKGEVENKIISLRDELIGFAETRQKREEIKKNFKEIMEKLGCSYRKIVNPSVITRDNKWIMARYGDERDENKYIIEVFKNKIPTKEGLKDYTGYYIHLDGEFERGSTVCGKMKVNWGKDSAPRYLWHHLNKIADDKGVEKPKETFESWGL